MSSFDPGAIPVNPPAVGVERVDHLVVRPHIAPIDIL
jgi:hypothetical protein